MGEIYDWFEWDMIGLPDYMVGLEWDMIGPPGYMVGLEWDMVGPLDYTIGLEWDMIGSPDYMVGLECYHHRNIFPRQKSRRKLSRFQRLSLIICSHYKICPRLHNSLI